ncbi:phage tail protein [Bradyrhizobium ivorense]|uniref:phage tail protein n=1 Tax=Bradyrhizobium ivorense TaxID=2511166 RepID=UPI0010B86D84|nr:tail fiber protein [Bradyrhizobium ivorense]VIO73906.1 hypothetical protein CI41S_40150 [Bradyrhizobium ivorense]
MPVYKWSQTSNNNAGADPTINWAEGQPPSSINDSARAMMAAVAKWRDDVFGILVASGTGSAYSVATNSVVTAATDGFTVQFTPAVTNTGPVTLAVDALGAAPLRFYTGKELPAGVVISGSLYQATYRAASGEWLLHGFDSSSLAIPIGASLDFWGATAPNGSFAFMQGQAISRTTFSTLFALMGTTFGPGDGTTTFNLPDKVGRVSVGADAGGARISGATFNSTTLGGVGGQERVTLTTLNLPPYTPAGNVTISNVSVSYPVRNYANSGSSVLTDLSLGSNVGSGAGTLTAGFLSGAGSFAGTAQGGTSAPITNIQPAIVCNPIIRII